MDKSLLDSLVNVCRLLEKHKVSYLVVGGTAVALYGYSRISISAWGEPIDKPDLDFWYNPSYENYFNLLNAIGELGEDVSEFKNETTPNPKKSYFKLNFDRFTIDFLPELPGLSKFSDSYEFRETISFEGVDVMFIGLDDLIANKLTMAREKDVADVDALKRVRKNHT